MPAVGNDSVTQTLIWRGITPPPPNSRKTTCPMCSATRLKRDERCLSVYIGNTAIEWNCHHCGYSDWEKI